MDEEEEEEEDSCNRGAQNLDRRSSERFDAFQAATERSSDQIVLTRIESGPKSKKETWTVATQTPLSFIDCNRDKYFIDAATSPFHFDDESRENVDIFSSALVRNQISIALSQEAVAVPFARLRSRISGDGTFQVSTSSYSSTKCEPRSEILTLTTDYDVPSPDACSIFVDATDQNASRGLHSPVRDAREPPCLVDLTLNLPDAESTSDDELVHRIDAHRRRWNIVRLLNRCLCVSAGSDEPDPHPYTRDAPPAYSTIYASRATTMRDQWRPFRSPNRSSIIAPMPPPSYAQAEGITLATYSMDHLYSVSPNTSRFWSSRPTTAVCPRCTAIIVTTIQVRQSMITHAAAVVLFLCGCWPCCMIPYCVNSCKIIDHYCPVCRAYLGTYRPW